MEEDINKLDKLNLYIGRLEKINTALPKPKSEKFDELLKPLYAKRTMLRFNISQKIKKA